MIIQNQGQRLIHTDYWDSEHAKAGALFLSWNAGAGRLLVPDNQKSMLREMKGASMVIVSRGPWVDQGGRDALELVFEDHSDAPFSIQLVTEQCDRMIPEYQQGGGFVVAVWTRGGMKSRFPGKYRLVDAIPCLQEWSEQ